MAGSASLKDVLPVLTKANYNGMEITDGNMANIEYYRVTFGKDVDEKERHHVRVALEQYCDLDTKGMVEILTRLQEIGG